MPTPFIISNPPSKRTENDDVLFENMVDRYIGRLVYFGSGNFVKANFPYARMLFVRVQAGGGSAGGSRSSAANQLGGGSGGGGGGYAESWIETTSLPASVPVTVGGGGPGASPGAIGNNGFPSEFGNTGAYRTRATGGGRGRQAVDTAGPIFRDGGNGGIGTHGQILIAGGPGGSQMGIEPSFFQAGGNGGDSMMGGGGRGGGGPGANAHAAGDPGRNYGGGSGGPTSRANAGSIGSPAGGPGIVIVEMYA